MGFWFLRARVAMIVGTIRMATKQRPTRKSWMVAPFVCRTSYAVGGSLLGVGLVLWWCGRRTGFGSVAVLAKNGRVQVPIQGFFAALRMTVLVG